MLHRLRRFVRPEWACLFLLACSTGGEDAAPQEISLDESLNGEVEIVSVERLEPGRNNRLEIVVELRNVGSQRRHLNSKLTWLDGAGRQRGGQSVEWVVQAGQQATFTAPTNDRRVASYRMVLSPAAELASPGAPPEDPLAISISVGSVGQTGYGTLSVWAPERAASFEVVIPEADCRRFQFYPGGACSVSAETPAGSTTTLMVAYEAKDDRSRRGRLKIGFTDPSREDIEVPLRGRIGDGKKGSRRITLD